MPDADDKAPGPADPVAALLTQGDHVNAARLCVERGELARAIAIYERLWRFADALPLALRLDDKPLAVRLALEVGDAAQAATLAQAIPSDAPTDLTRAAQAFAGRGRHWDAARLAERAGDLALAGTLYRRAASFLDVGRMEEAAGRAHEAGLAYEQARARAGTATEQAAATLALGRLFFRLGRAEDATRAFQAAMRVDGFRIPAGRALVGALRALGLSVAATEVAARLRHLDPALPTSLDELIALDAADAAAQASPTGVVGAQPSAMGPRFKVLRLLGAGATSQVYLAEDTLLGHGVALKLLSPGTVGSVAERQAYARFAREAEAAGRLRHPNIVALFDADPAAGLFVWELLPAGALAERLADGQVLSLAEARRLALDLLSALSAAHDKGIIHRDVKPANVLYDQAGNAKLADFGAAHLVDFGQTQTGGLLGTVAYMSPEQITGAALGPAADLYALAVTLFQALTGRLPFPGPDIVAQHLGDDPPRPSSLRTELSDAHDAVLLRALAKAPAERWESAREMAEAIATWPVGASTTTRAEGVVVAVGREPSSRLTAPQALGRSLAGALFRQDDARLGRTVLVEARESALEGPALDRLRAVAALGGPFVQRVLALSADARSVTYEFLAGARQPLTTLPVALADTLAQTHRALVDAGQLSAHREADVIVTPAGPVLPVVEFTADQPG